MTTSTRTRLGIDAENYGAPASNPGIIATAQAAERMGVDSISVSDHLLTFEDSEYWLEAMTSLAAIASVTNHAKLVTSVVVLPQRNVLEFLRVMHTVDALSNGRLVVGVGAGWNKRESEGLGYDFHTRGRRMDEMMAVMQGVDAGIVPPFRGKQIQVPEGITITPHPELGRRIPLYVGGSASSMAAVERALEHGDGWMAYSMAGNINRESVVAALTRLRAGRDRDGLPHLDTIYKLGVTGVDDPHMIMDVQALASLGFDEVIVQGIWDRGIEAGIDAIGRIREVLS